MSTAALKRELALLRSSATISPMLAAAPAAQQILLSTPAGAAGEFYRAWISGEDLERVQITADQCPRISAAHLAAERIRLGDALYRQEYFGASSRRPAASSEGADLLITRTASSSSTEIISDHTMMTGDLHHVCVRPRHRGGGPADWNGHGQHHGRARGKLGAGGRASPVKRFALQCALRGPDLRVIWAS